MKFIISKVKNILDGIRDIEEEKFSELEDKAKELSNMKHRKRIFKKESSVSYGIASS